MGTFESYSWRLPKLRNDVKEQVTVYGTPKDPPAVSIPQSQEGIPVPWFIGKCRQFSPNIMMYGNLLPIIEVTRTSSTDTFEEPNPKTIRSPFPGDNGKVYNPWVAETRTVERETVTVTESVVGYTADTAFGICLGPGVRLRGVYENDVLVWEGDSGPAVITLSDQSSVVGRQIEFLDGSITQTPRNIAGLIGVPGYVGICYVLVRGLRISGGTTKFAFEVSRHVNPLGFAAGVNVNADGDINLATALYAAITEERGGGGVPPTMIDTASFVAAGIKLAAEGNFCTLWQPNDGVVKNVISVIEQQARGKVTQSKETGLIEFNLIRYEGVDLPNTKLFDEKSIIKLSSFSIPVAAINFPNYGRATFTDRSANYAEGVAIGETVVSLSRGGRVRNPIKLEFPGCMTQYLCRQLIAREMAYAASRIKTGGVELTRDAYSLRLGEIIRLKHPKFGDTPIPFEVTRVRDSDINSNKVIVNLSTLPTLSTKAVLSPPEENLYTPLDPAPVAPKSVRVLDAPFFLAYTQSSLLGAASPLFLVERENAMQTSFSIWYENQAGQPGPYLTDSAKPYASVGELNAALAWTEGFNTGVIPTIRVNNIIDPSQLRQGGVDQMRQGASLVFINNEIFVYEGFTKVTDTTYDLLNVRRAMLDTASTNHAIGSKVFIVPGFTKLPARPTELFGQLNANGPFAMGENRTATAVGSAKFPIPFTGAQPSFRLTGNALYRAMAYAEGGLNTLYTPNARANCMVRPQWQTIAGNRVQSAAVTKGSQYAIGWRNRAPFQTDQLEFANDATKDPYYLVIGSYVQVWFRDGAGTVTKLADAPAVTATAATTVNVTIPAGAASGSGAFWLRTAHPDYPSSLYWEETALTIA